MLVDNYIDMIVLPSNPVDQCIPLSTTHTLLAEHGLSCFVRIFSGKKEHRVLFDTGLSREYMTRNARQLVISFAGIEVIVLSHGHFDHTGGLHDPIKDDLTIVVNAKDKGLVLLIGCAHAGFINMVEYVKKITGIDHVHAVLGGLHLTEPALHPSSSRRLMRRNGSTRITSYPFIAPDGTRSTGFQDHAFNEKIPSEKLKKRD